MSMTHTDGAMTMRWAAPEMFPSDGDDDVVSHKTEATDTWALGCTIFEVNLAPCISELL